MKKEILKLAKELGINIQVETWRMGFDIIDYHVSIDSVSDGCFTYFTGKTSNGVKYFFDKDAFMESIKKFIVTSTLQARITI